MKRMRWTVVGPVGLMAAALGTAGVFCGASCVRSKGPTPRQVERQIRADVPLGTPMSAVRDYLRGRGIRFVTDDVADVDRQVSDLAGLGNREDREIGIAVIEATVEPAFVDLMWPGRVTVYFFFDPQGRVIGIACVSHFDAP